MKQNKIIWRDIDIPQIIISLIFLILLFIFIFYLNPFKNIHSLFGILYLKLGESIGFPFMIIVFIFFIYQTFRIKLTYITNDGIRIGNAPDHKYTCLKLKQKPIFLEWGQIKQINIVNHAILVKYFSILKPFIIVKTNNRKKYECFLAQPKGFVKALKSINRQHLLSKDSKYRDEVE